MVEADRAKLVELNQKRDRRLGTSGWLPVLNDERTEKVWVFEKDGEVIGAFLLRRVWESFVVGDSPDVMRAILESQDKMRLIAQSAGVDELIGFVPETLVSGRRGMEKLMKRGKFSRIKGMVAFESNTEISEGESDAEVK